MRYLFVLIFLVSLGTSGARVTVDGQPDVAKADEREIRELFFQMHRVEVVEALKKLHIALSCYLVDHESWPQCPFDEAKEPKEFDEWWKDVLEEYGIEEHVWETRGMRFPPGEVSGRVSLSHIVSRTLHG